MIMATVKYHLSVLKELIRAGADLNLQNQVTAQVNSATVESLSYLSIIRKDLQL